MMDHDQLSQLFAIHSATLVLYARQWLDRTSAEDVVQEAYIALLQQRRAPESAKAWLYRAVRNGAISQYRSYKRRVARDSLAQREFWFEASTESAMDGEMAMSAMKTLPESQREVVVLRIWGQMNLAEIAKLTGTSTTTAFDRYRAGLAALRTVMGATCQEKQ